MWILQGWENEWKQAKVNCFRAKGPEERNQWKENTENWSMFKEERTKHIKRQGCEVDVAAKKNKTKKPRGVMKLYQATKKRLHVTGHNYQQQ